MKKIELIGKIGRPRGLQGDFFVSGRRSLLTAMPASTPIIVGQQDSTKTTKIIRHTVSNDRDIIRLACFSDRTQLEPAIGEELWVQSDLGTTTHELSSWGQLSVFDIDGIEMGVITEFFNFGGTDNLEVTTTHSKPARSLLIPVCEPYITPNSQTLTKGICLNVAAQVFAGLWYDTEED